jgi:uncharacterized ferredoxin-like protein
MPNDAKDKVVPFFHSPENRTYHRIGEYLVNCGACGYKSCKDILAGGKREGEDFTGPVCIFQAIDLGIALGSEVKLAGELNIDNRTMYTVGAAAKKLSLLDSELIIGIPLSVTGKNPYFDRP